MSACSAGYCGSVLAVLSDASYDWVLNKQLCLLLRCLVLQMQQPAERGGAGLAWKLHIARDSVDGCPGCIVKHNLPEQIGMLFTVFDHLKLECCPSANAVDPSQAAEWQGSIVHFMSNEVRYLNSRSCEECSLMEKKSPLTIEVSNDKKRKIHRGNDKLCMTTSDVIAVAAVVGWSKLCSQGKAVEEFPNVMKQIAQGTCKKPGQEGKLLRLRKFAKLAECAPVLSALATVNKLLPDEGFSCPGKGAWRMGRVRWVAAALLNSCHHTPVSCSVLTQYKIISLHLLGYRS